jgi:REP element-mobilizing transposase RayT
MRQPRLKLPSALSAAAYHCMSRIVNGEHLLDDLAKEVFRRILWQVADYCGLEVLTYVIMINHFHLLVRVPVKVPVSDEELLRRYRVLYPKPTKYQSARFEAIRQELAVNGPAAVLWRQRQLALMGDLSPFMQLVKERFSIWYNRTHGRFGTLWAERYKSVLVEPQKQALQTMAAYIDLNAVRKGLIQDPKDYRFCGYAEAVAGHPRARQGLQAVLGTRSWEQTQCAYRERLFTTATGPREKDVVLDREALAKVIREKGRLPLATVLRCRLRYFHDGAVLGSRAYVAEQLAEHHRRSGCRPSDPRPLPDCTDWGDLTVMRGLRRAAYG